MSGMLKLGMPVWAEVGPRESRVNSPHLFSLPIVHGEPARRRSAETGDACTGRSRSSREQSELSLVFSLSAVRVMRFLVMHRWSVFC